jgi:hypothetical protein
MNTTICQQLAILVQSRDNCEKANNTEWFSRHENAAEFIVKNTAPSGSGIDCGTKILLDECSAEKLVFQANFHHMNDVGYYDGWTEHKIIVTPSLAHGFNLRVTGRNRNDIKEYLADEYHYWLSQEYMENARACVSRG